MEKVSTTPPTPQNNYQLDKGFILDGWLYFIILICELNTISLNLWILAQLLFIENDELNIYDIVM